MEITLAIILGTLFGFVLHRVGATDPNLIIDMLRLRNLHLMKAILLGIAVASALLFVGMAVGVIDPGHLSVKAMYWGVLPGGALLGAGWALSGFCPGTGVAAMGNGRKDAVFFVLGGLVGAGLYMMVFAQVEQTGILTDVLGGKAALAQTPGNAYPAIIAGAPGIVVALVLAAVLGGIAWALPNTLGEDSGS